MKTQSTNRNDSTHCTSAIMGSMTYSIETSYGEIIIYCEQYVIDTLLKKLMEAKENCTQSLLNFSIFNIVQYSLYLVYS
jgi:hypothetical protein